VWIIGNSIKLLENITFIYPLLTKFWIPCPKGKFSFLDGFKGYNQIQIVPKDQDKTTFTCPWGNLSYRVLPFRLCNALTTFQRVVLSIFSDVISDCMEIFMDDFTSFGS